MINQSKLDLIYDLVVENGNLLSTKSLKEIGFNSYDISKLLEDATLTREKRGIYKFNDVNKLFYYGKFLVSQKGFSNGTKCFERCYEIDRTHSGVCFQLFLRAIQKEDYERAILLMEELDKNHNQFYRKDYNFYIFILNFLTTLPELYKKRVQRFKLKDLLITDNDKRYKNMEIHNKIRKLVFNQKFYNATNEVDLLFKYNKDNLSVQDIITKNLVKNISRDSYKKRQKMYALAETKDYKEIINVLEKKESEVSLSFEEFIIKKLAEKLLLAQNGETFIKYTTNSYNLIITIENNDFFKAYKNREYFCAKNHISQSEDLISFMLKDLITFSKIKESNREENNYSNILEDIKTLLNCGKIGLTLNLINDLLYVLNMRQYEKMISNLIEIDILESYNCSNRTLKFIHGLINKEAIINLKEFVENFILSLAQNEKEKSELYLSVLEEGSNLFGCKLPISRYYQALHGVKHSFISDSLIEEKHEEMSNYGISIFENITIEELTIIGEKLTNYKDINISFFEENGLNLVLRNKSLKSLAYNGDEEILGDKAYENQEYTKSLNYYLKVLYSRHAKVDTYAKLGFIYYKLGNSKKSLDYFKVAKAFSKARKINGDYERLINVLEEQLIYDEEMINSNDNFGLGDISYVRDFIATSGLDIESACSLLRLNEDEIKILMLVFTKEFYCECDFEKGDQLLNLVIQKKENSPKIIKIINFLIRNKIHFNEINVLKLKK